MNENEVKEVLDTASATAVDVANSEPSTGRVIGELVVGGTIIGLAVWKGIDLGRTGWRKLKGYIDKRKAAKENVVSTEELENFDKDN